jgi:hypothetical protein
MTIAINVLLVLLGAVVAIVAAFGGTHNPSADGHLRRLNARGWIIVVSVISALILGVVKEYSAAQDQREQWQLLKDIFASRQADHQLLTSLLQRQPTKGGTEAAPEAAEHQNLLKEREQWLQAAENELLGARGARRSGAGPTYRHLQDKIREIDLRLAGYQKRKS